MIIDEWLCCCFFQDIKLLSRNSRSMDVSGSSLVSSAIMYNCIFIFSLFWCRRRGASTLAFDNIPIAITCASTLRTHWDKIQVCFISLRSQAGIKAYLHEWGPKDFEVILILNYRIGLWNSTWTTAEAIEFHLLIFTERINWPLNVWGIENM